MCEILFRRPFTIQLQQAAAFAEARRKYLKHLSKQGYTRATLQAVARDILVVAERLQAAPSGEITLETLAFAVDINTIRAWLGHVSLGTTNVYAEIDVEMKSRALAKCEINGGRRTRRWREDANLMAFLR